MYTQNKLVMMMNNPCLKYFFFIPAIVIAVSCQSHKTAEDKESLASTPNKGSYAYDVDFLKKHTGKVLELVSPDGNSKILLSADYQGRVMTSTAAGDNGTSFGWLNYDLISAKEKRKQFNPVGGEERFWMGPEGGQYSIYFKGKDSFDFKNWQVPAFLDTEGFDVQNSGESEVTFVKNTQVTNYSGATFDLSVERRIEMLNRQDLVDITGTDIPGDIRFVGYKTVNRITNTGNNDWLKEKGLLSVWLLGMFTPTPSTVVMIPFRPIPDAEKHITDNYFGSIPEDRLLIKDSVLFFSCDGKYRSKIGLSPEIAKPVAASFDFNLNVLTLVIPEIHPGAPYVNSKWERQSLPYRGDVINAYNDGPLADGSQMGPFYEIESSSPALALKKDSSAVYTQSTCHLEGEYPAMKILVQNILGIDLDTIKK